ncbi:helix-turn-helix transcriptional regulator [Streptomyces sp. NPDC001941]|uniref:helix-turn-helix transcriptional regulator n=1 Tax=Streptomyces sp. NPDC001941 TaxID=3154659 RepID=UPI00331DE258
MTLEQLEPAAPWPGTRERVERAGRLLRAHGRLVVHGPWGSGRGTLLDALALDRHPGVRLLRVAPIPGDRALAYSAVTQLLAGLPAGAPDALPAGQLGAVQMLLRSAEPYGPPADPDPVAVRLALAALLGAARTLLVVDDAQWVDEASADAFAHALRAVPAEALSVAVAERSVLDTPAARRLCGDHPARLPLGPLTVEEVADLLARHGLSSRWAAHTHRHCGGHPLLVRACAEAVVQHQPRSWKALPPPGRVQDLAALWLGTLPSDARHTLMALALAQDTAGPGPADAAALLRRAGRDDADEHLAAAARAGLVRQGARDRVEFIGEAVREAALRAGTRAGRRSVHRALAAATEDPVHAVRHRLLAAEGPDGELARQADRSAAWARSGGERALAAELMLLAARHTPVDRREDRIARLADAALDAAAAGCHEDALRAADALAAARAGGAEQVAALLSVVDAGGQAMEEMDEVLARARDLAAGRPDLLAAVELRAAVRHNIGGRPRQAVLAAERAVQHAESGGDAALETAALTMRARMERVTGLPGAAETLSRALARGGPGDGLAIRNSPQYLAVRHAVFDDRLAGARADLMELLPVAERTGDAEDLMEVLRSLAEVDARAGAAARALLWSERAVEVCTRAGLSPGPVWYTAALAETAGGSFRRAAEHALLGVRASREEHDLVFTSRGLLALGTVCLATGEAARAVEALSEVAALEGGQEVGDPTMLRWQPELAEALVAVGRVEEAGGLLDALGGAVGARALATGLGASLRRSRALHRAALGDPDEAARQLGLATDHFTDLGLPLEEGRTRLAAGRVERGRRRYAAARTAWQRAAEVFDAAGAYPWKALATDLLTRLDASAVRAGAPLELTDSERNLAELVAAGATNQEAAQTLFVSVKTVEATLSRVYRKLSIRSRTQLPLALGRGS